jgi:hypothetical protein
MLPPHTKIAIDVLKFENRLGHPEAPPALAAHTLA